MIVRKKVSRIIPPMSNRTLLVVFRGEAAICSITDDSAAYATGNVAVSDGATTTGLGRTWTGVGIGVAAEARVIPIVLARGFPKNCTTNIVSCS